MNKKEEEGAERGKDRQMDGKSFYMVTGKKNLPSVDFHWGGIFLILYWGKFV